MAQSVSPQTWYLEIQGKKKGPFTLNEIQAMLTRGEVSPKTRVLHDNPIAPQLTVQDLFKAVSDPAHTLLNALQIARDKQKFAKRDSEKEIQFSKPKKSRKIKSLSFSIGLGLLILCIVLATRKNKTDSPPAPISEAGPISPPNTIVPAPIQETVFSPTSVTLPNPPPPPGSTTAEPTTQLPTTPDPGPTSDLEDTGMMPPESPSFDQNNQEIIDSVPPPLPPPDENPTE